MSKSNTVGKNIKVLKADKAVRKQNSSSKARVKATKGNVLLREIEMNEFPTKRISPVKPGKRPGNVINLNKASGYTVKDSAHIKVRYNTLSRPVWDKEKVAYLIDYLEKLVIIMRLSDWSIVIEISDKDKEVFATMESQPDQRRAILTLTSRFLQLDREDQRQTLTHELIHCHLFALHYQSEEAFKVYSTSKAQELFAIMMECEVEKATDALADILAVFLPEFILPN